MSTLPRLSDHDVEIRLGYTPCVCGVLDGTWHSSCYKNKTKEQIATGYRRAFRIAREQLIEQDKLKAISIINKAQLKEHP